MIKSVEEGLERYKEAWREFFRQAFSINEIDPRVRQTLNKAWYSIFPRAIRSKNCDAVAVLCTAGFIFGLTPAEQVEIIKEAFDDVKAERRKK